MLSGALIWQRSSVESPVLLIPPIKQLSPPAPTNGGYLPICPTAIESSNWCRALSTEQPANQRLGFFGPGGVTKCKTLVPTQEAEAVAAGTGRVSIAHQAHQTGASPLAGSAANDAAKEF